MSDLPMGWTESAVGDLVELNPKNFCRDDADVAFIPMSRLGKTYLGTVTFETKKWNEVNRGYSHFSDGDVLLAKITPCFENGKAGIVDGLPNKIGAGSTEYFVCRPLPKLLLSKYLLAFFKTEKFLNDGALQMTGSVGHKRVTKSYLTDAIIPLPPFNEQKRIVDKLDALFAAVDASRARLDRIPMLIKRFRQSVLTAATSGALTEDWRELKNIELSEWTNARIQDIAAVGTGSTPLRSNDLFYVNGTIPWITSAATSQEIVTKAMTHVTEAAVAAHRLKRFEKGTLLIAMYGEGKTRGQVCELGIVATINQACAAIKVDINKAVVKYVKFSLQGNYLQMRAMAEGGNQPNLNLSKVKEFLIQLPTMDEQREIVRRVERLFDAADKMEASLAKAREHVEKLTPSILAQAFRGDLVEQDPINEPENASLSRINSACTSSHVRKPTRKAA